MIARAGQSILLGISVLVVTSVATAGDFIDCNGNGAADVADIAFGVSEDCNSNQIPDECDLDSGTSQDCDASEVPDECESDCNGNGLHDSCDLASGVSEDCNSNGVSDDCDTQVKFHRHAIFTDLTYSTVGADLGNDGDLDLIANTTTESQHRWGIAWYANDGSGVFGPEQIVDGNIFALLTAADMNNDGQTDILASSYGAVYWYENIGNGFGQRIPVEPTSPESAWTLPVVTADLDGDDDLDVLHIFSLLYPPHALVWYENLDDQPLFGSGQTIYTGDDKPSSVDAADVDGDGDEDVVCGRLTQLEWYENDGAGSFTPHVIESTVGATSVFADDIDQDGDPDLMTVEFNNGVRRLVWYENLDGAGSFSSARIVNGQPDTRGQASLMDLDGDGDLDVVALSGINEDIAWNENLDGRGTFGERSVIVVTGNDILNQHPFAGDFDGDGDLDLLYESLEVDWTENLSDDCNGNDVPDACEPDCNASGLVDACDLKSGASVDCDYNTIPDECDSACISCNADEDICLDERDCAPDDPSAWSEPTAATSLRLWGGSPTGLSWQPPSNPGAWAVRYDTLRSDLASNFFGTTVCLDPDGVDRLSEDGSAPDAGELFYYLIRVENNCPGGSGTMGTDSSDMQRVGMDCS